MTRPLPQLDERMAALETAATRATLVSAFCDVPPCTLVLHPDRLEIRVGLPARAHGTGLPPRRAVQGAGAVVLGVRVALAGQGWAVEVERFPLPDDPELLAVLRPRAGGPEAGLAPLAAVAAGGPLPRRTARPRPPSPALLDRLARAAAAEDTVLLPVTSAPGRRLIDQLEVEAQELLRAPTGLPHRGTPVPDVVLLLATAGDDELAWLRSGEATERVLLELADVGRSAVVVADVLDAPLVRARVRSALCWDDHPQTLIRAW